MRIQNIEGVMIASYDQRDNVWVFMKWMIFLLVPATLVLLAGEIEHPRFDETWLQIATCILFSFICLAAFKIPKAFEIRVDPRTRTVAVCRVFERKKEERILGFEDIAAIRWSNGPKYVDVSLRMSKGEPICLIEDSYSASCAREAYELAGALSSSLGLLVEQ